MGLLSRFWKKFLALFRRIFRKIAHFIKKYWYLIVAVLIVWFAPQISAWLIAQGAPSFLVTAVQSLVPASEWLHTAAAAVWKLGAKLFVNVGLDWETMALGTKCAVIAGGLFLIAPDETKALFAEVANSAVKYGKQGLNHGAKALGLPPVHTWLWWGLGGLITYKVLTRKKGEAA